MENKPFSQRKRTRLPEFDYSQNYMYFITVCTKDKASILGRIVGDGACDVPHAALFPKGKVAEKYIHLMDNKYNNVFIDCYVIMPNHIHMIIAVSNPSAEEYDKDIRVGYFGTSQAPSPTPQSIGKMTLHENPDRTNKIIPKFISLFKRYCNHKAGENIWQRGYYDRIIRNYHEYINVRNYIDANPFRWTEDEYYI